MKLIGQSETKFYPNLHMSTLNKKDFPAQFATDYSSSSVIFYSIAFLPLKVNIFEIMLILYSLYCFTYILSVERVAEGLTS